MRHLFLIPAIWLLAAVHCVAAGTAAAQWQKGAEFYKLKQYDSAAWYFEQVAAQHPSSADLYYNLGNTYYKLNKVALSILNYQRALRIAPKHQAAQDNLVLAQARISSHIHNAEDIFFVSWWRNVTREGMATSWAIFTLVAFALIIAFILMRRYSKAGSRIPVQMPGIFAFLFVCLMVLAIASAKRSVEHSMAVVMINDTPLLTEQLKGKPIALIPEGITVKLNNENGSWIEVSLPDGRSGWVQQSAIQKI